MSRRAFVITLIGILAAGATLRLLWLRADPPVTGAVGIVWHDEGAWVHNARNRALWGQWRTDAWNPMFITPVFTALEYESFRAFGVGLWQARTVPVASGLLAIVMLVAGLRALANRQAALVGGALLAGNYVFVMWNRAALMESTMTAFLVASWAAYALADRREAGGALWGLAAGVFATLAWFSKASAAFFIAGLVLDSVWRVAAVRRSGSPGSGGPGDCTAGPRTAGPRAALFTLGGLVVSVAVVGAIVVFPHWTEYRFYNWQMTVTRKPDYSLHALADRASWLPIVQGLFTRMWIVVALGFAGLVSIYSRWREARPAERVLVLWVLLGVLELVVHDSGNERRYVMFVPALVASSALLLASGRPFFSPDVGRDRGVRRLLAFPLLLVVGYLVFGSLLRPMFLSQIDAGHLSLVVRLSAGLAVALAAVGTWKWGALLERGSMWRASWPVAAALVIAVAAGDLTQYGIWVASRSEKNFDASVALGHLVPPGTLIQGKLANGMSLDNRIRPLFVGNGFGNYDDRLRRDDARYILTYDLPRLGYESSDGSGLIQGILAHYPGWREIATFDVDETPAPDRAALIDKFPTVVTSHARD